MGDIRGKKSSRLAAGKRFCLIDRDRKARKGETVSERIARDQAMTLKVVGESDDAWSDDVLRMDWTKSRQCVELIRV